MKYQKKNMFIFIIIVVHVTGKSFIDLQILQIIIIQYQNNKNIYKNNSNIHNNSMNNFFMKQLVKI